MILLRCVWSEDGKRTLNPKEPNEQGYARFYELDVDRKYPSVRWDRNKYFTIYSSAFIQLIGQPKP